MVPGGKAAQVKHISLKINTADFTVKSWTIVNKSGKKQLFSVTKLNPKAGADDAFFTFNKKAFPGVEVNDLR
jgi:outer membrane lipoprotein-sorting protein